MRVTITVSNGPRLAAVGVMLGLALSACAGQPEPVVGPGPSDPENAAVQPDPLLDPAQAEEAAGLAPAGLDTLTEDPVVPEEPTEEFRAPTEEEIDRTLRGMLGDDPIGLVMSPDATRAHLPLEMNDRVEAWISYFQNVIPERFQLYLERMGRFEPMIRRKLSEQEMPQDLIYLSLIESGMNANAYSRAAAVGLWQFIRGTARLYGLEVSFWVDERRDPEKATEAALRYLSDLHDEFGSWYLAAAAYNGGPGRIRRGLARRSDATFWDLADARLLRSETRNYVPKLIAAAIIGHDPERYGFRDLSTHEPIAYDVVTIPDATSFDVLAEAAETDQETIRALNPQFPQNVTPPDRAVELKVPEGTGARFQTRYAAIPPDERVTWTFHVVQRGQTLGQIGANYGVSVTALRAANGNIDPRRLQIGQRLVIPIGGTRTASSSTSSRTGTARAEPRAAVSEQSALETARSVTVVVRRGDSLWTIARRYSVSTRDIMQWNGLNSTVIRPGDRLEIRR